MSYHIAGIATILAASCADIESNFLGCGPSNLQALFSAAERDGGAAVRVRGRSEPAPVTST